MSIISSLSFHNDITWSIEHDTRTSSVLPDNVNPNDTKYNIYWKNNMTLKQFYDKYFEASYKEYCKRSRVKNPEKTYLEKISKTATEKEKLIRDLKNSHAPYKELNKHKSYCKPAYQIVITIGNCHDNPEFKHGGDMEETAKEILSNYMNTFEERNQGLKLVCGAIHCDEGDRFDENGNIEKVGGNIHLHLTYVPVATCTRGQSVQNSLSQALKMQGLESGRTKNVVTGKYETAQIKWQNQERNYISELCSEHEITILSQNCDDFHRSVEDYQRQRDIQFQKELKKANEEKEKQLVMREKSINNLINSNPKVADTLKLIDDNMRLSEQVKKFNSKEAAEKQLLSELWNNYKRQNSHYWDYYKENKIRLKEKIKQARETKNFTEEGLEAIMDDIFSFNTSIIEKLILLVCWLFLKYQEKNIKKKLEELALLNRRMKNKAKIIVDAGQRLSYSLKSKYIDNILYDMEKWEKTLLEFDIELEEKVKSELNNKQSLSEIIVKYKNFDRFDFDEL